MRSLGYLAIGLLGLAAITFACSSQSSATDSGGLCTAGNFVYCRCEDRAEGTKLCHDDGRGFDVCKCDGSGEGPVSDYDAGPLEPFDAGGPTEGLHIDNACTGKLGIVAGGIAGDSNVYLLGYKGDGVFDAVKSSGGVAGPIAVVASAGSLLASYKGNFAILTTKYTNNTWIPIAAIGNDMVTTFAKGTTASTLFGTSAKLMFISGDDNRYHVATYGTAGWDDGSTVAEFNQDAGLSGKSAPALAAAGTQLVAVVSTDDGALARETFDSSWGPFIKAPENAQNVPPALASLEAGSPKDLLLVWPAKDGKLHSASRDALSKTWSNGSIIDAGLLSNQAAIAPLPNGDALVVIVVTDHGYTSLFHAQTGTFDAPTELVPGANPKLAGIPGVTRGHCGEDASIAYAEDGGAVKVLRYTASKFDGPYVVGGVPNGAKFVGIGELP